MHRHHTRVSYETNFYNNSKLVDDPVESAKENIRERTQDLLSIFWLMQNFGGEYLNLNHVDDCTEIRHLGDLCRKLADGYLTDHDNLSENVRALEVTK